MSRYEKVSLAISLTIILALIASWMQLREVARQNRMIVYSQREASTLMLDRLFIEYPETRDYFYSGVEIDANHPSYRRVLAIAEIHLDVFDYKLKHAEHFAEYEPFREVEEKFMRDMFRTSPILRKYCEQRKEWYSPKLQALAQQEPR